MKKLSIVIALLIAAIFTIPTGCKKDESSQTNSAAVNGIASARGAQARMYNADVANGWMKMQIKVMSTAVGIPQVLFCHYYAVSAVTLYQALVPGMPSYQSLATQLNTMPAMPALVPNLEYHWPAGANAAMASILKKLYPTTSAANLASIDSLENVFNALYSTGTDAAIITRSVDYGRAVAQLVYDWSQTDGIQHVNDPYTPPVGAGLWVPTAPAFATAITPYWGNLRPMVAGSGTNAQPGPPTPYSEVSGSDFYLMVKNVYDVSQNLTQAQKDQALYWRDAPGVTGPGHLLNILIQVVDIENPNLEKAAYAFALCGITANESSISCWITKYGNNLVRPITYIRNVLGYSTWTSFLGTPAHPEYSSAHSVISSANAAALTSIFGDNYSFTDHTYDYMGFPARSFSSFTAIGEDAGNSRVLAGIHYEPSVNAGLIQGRAVAQNIISRLVFKKP